MKYLWALVAIMFILISFFRMNISAEIVDDFRVVLEYKENYGRIIYFDVSENNKLCIAYDNDKVYEYDLDGKFIRIIEYKSNGNVYAYYQNENLVINDIRKDLHVVIDENNMCIESFEAPNTNFGFYVSEECRKNIKFTKNSYEYQYISHNWFSRVFLNKKSQISVSFEDEIIIKVEEKIKIIDDLIPVLIIVILFVILYGFKKIEKYKH